MDLHAAFCAHSRIQGRSTGPRSNLPAILHVARLDISLTLRCSGHRQPRDVKKIAEAGRFGLACNSCKAAQANSCSGLLHLEKKRNVEEAEALENGVC